MDSIDRGILSLLQENAWTSLANISRRVGLSVPAVHGRIKKLEKNGPLRKCVAILDGDRIGCGMTAFVEVFIESSRLEKRFVESIRKIPEVIEIHYVSGDSSCLLKIKTFDRISLKQLVLDRINAQPGVRQTKTILVLSTVKEETAIPLPKEIP